MESVIKLVAYFISETVTNLTEEQKAQLELSYAKADALQKKDLELLKSLFAKNDAEVDELITHWGKIKEEK